MSPEEDFMENWRRELEAKDAERQPIYSTVPRIREARFDVPKLPEPKEEFKPYAPVLCGCIGLWETDTLQVVLSGFSATGCHTVTGTSVKYTQVTPIDGSYLFSIDREQCLIGPPQIIASVRIDFYPTSDCSGAPSSTEFTDVNLTVEMGSAGVVDVVVGISSLETTRAHFECSTKDFISQVTEHDGTVYNEGSITIDSV